MENVSKYAELLYVISNYEKGRVKSSGIWDKKYVQSFKKSLEIMEMIVNLISTKKEISKDEISFLQEFIHKNKGMIFSDVVNVEVCFSNKEENVVLPVHSEDVLQLMNDIILDINNLLSTKGKNYKMKISYLLKAFHNLPRVFLEDGIVRIFNMDIKPITPEESIKYALSYIFYLKKKAGNELICIKHI